MRIGIVTQPLQANYGGILQNYALQSVLKDLGHEPLTIDYGNKITIFRYIVSTLRSIVFFFVPNKRRPFAKFCETKHITRKSEFNRFIYKYITKTEDTGKYDPKYIKRYKFEAVITGSDQVWRPQYNEHIEDMYLRFVRQPGVKKIAYAASFGTEKWEYSARLTQKCKLLASKLDFVSVREASGVGLCRKYLDVDALCVLDPTMLLKALDYESLCEDVPRPALPYIAAYLLDRSNEIDYQLDEMAKRENLDLRIFEADSNSTLSVEQWLAVFRDAKYVVTDSFHGTVFSIVFNKPFVCLGNKSRGNARFDSLLKMLGLESRLLEDGESINNVLHEAIDWYNVNFIIDSRRRESVDYLVKSLR